MDKERGADKGRERVRQRERETALGIASQEKYCLWSQTGVCECAAV